MNKFLIALMLTISLHIVILWKLIFFPYPEFFVYPYLNNQGLKPYGQIMDQHFPGLMFLPINFDNLGMLDENAARWWLVAIVVIVHLFLYIIGKDIFKDSKKALLLNVLYLIWQPFFEGWTLWIDSFLPLFLLPSFYFYLKFLKDNKRLTSLFLAGLFLGISIVFKQVMIPLAAVLYGLTLLQGRGLKVSFLFLAGLIAPMLLVMLYLWNINVLHDFWYWTVVFNITTFAEYARKLPTLTQLIRLGFVFFFSSLIFFEKDRRLKLLLLIFMLASLASINARFDFIHFQPALPFVITGTVAGFLNIWKNKFSKIILVGYFVITTAWLLVFYSGHLTSKVFFFDEFTKLVSVKIQTYTDPGDKIFIFGAVPHLYQMSKTIPAGNIFVFQFPWFLMVAEDRILNGLMEDKPFIIVSDRTVEIEGNRITDYARKIDRYIQDNYFEIDRVNNTVIMRRRELI